MNEKTVLIIQRGKDARFRGYIRNYDNYKSWAFVYDTDGITPVFVTASLLSAVKKAELYCIENFVECNYRIRL